MCNTFAWEEKCLDS